MFIINDQSTPKYSKLANKTINPGSKSRDLDVFRKAYADLMKATKGFKVVLSDEDLDVLRAIVSKWVVGELMDVEALGVEREPYNPRAGFDRLIDTIVARRRMKQSAISKRLSELREQEAKIQSESNFIDESGNPVNDKTMDTAVREQVEPVRHDEMSNDLKSVLENNLAVMTSASGQPIKDMGKNVIKAGSTEVPTDPKWYQTHKSDLPPGMPDMEASHNIVRGEQMKAAMKGRMPGVPTV